MVGTHRCDVGLSYFLGVGSDLNAGWRRIVPVDDAGAGDAAYLDDVAEPVPCEAAPPLGVARFGHPDAR